MKKFIAFLTLIVLAMMVTSCTPNKFDIVDQYFAQSGLFKCEVRYLHEPTWDDTSHFKVDVYYVMAKNKWNVQREFEDTLKNLTQTLNGVEISWVEIPITLRQDYPYRY